MGINDNRKFVEIPEDDYNSMSVDYSLLLSDEPTWSVDNSKCFLKYVGAKPSFISSYTTLYYNDFLEIIKQDYETDDDVIVDMSDAVSKLEEVIAEEKRLGSE